MMRLLQQVRRICQQRKPLELTVALIKPDACSNPLVVKKIQDIMMDNFYIIRTRFLRLSHDQAEEFYDIHKDKFFFNRLVTFMSSGPIYAHILAEEDAIAKWRKSMGPTKSYRAQYEAPSSVRGQFGLTDTRNAVHGSDSVESANREISFFFPEFDPVMWLKNEEKHFFRNNVKFSLENLAHHVIHSHDSLKS